MKVDDKQLKKLSKKEGGKYKPPIALSGETAKKATKDNSLTLKLQSSPGTDGSPTYEVSIPLLDGTETPFQAIQFMENIKKVFVGQNLTAGPNQCAMARRLLKDQPLAKFEENKGNQETVGNCEKALLAVLKFMLPKKPVQRQRRYMRRDCHKPPHLTIRQCATAFINLDGYLPKLARPFHVSADANNNNVPFVASAYTLADDEKIDILHNRIPQHWQDTMALHQFDPLDNSIEDFVEFCERLEMSEGNCGATFSTGETVKETTTSTTTKRKAEKKPTKHCMKHGLCSHTAHECRDVKRMLGELEEDTKPAAKKARFHNKTWQRSSSNSDSNKKSFDKDKYNKHKKNSELNAFVLTATKSAVRSELEAFFAEKEAKEKAETNAAMEVDPETLNDFNGLELSDDDNDSLLDDVSV